MFSLCGKYISPDTTLVQVKVSWQYFLILSNSYQVIYFARKDRPFLGTRQIEDGVAKEYKWETHREVRNHIENFGKGLKKLGLTRQKAIGVFSINRREWVSPKYEQKKKDHNF